MSISTTAEFIAGVLADYFFSTVYSSSHYSFPKPSELPYCLVSTLAAAEIEPRKWVFWSALYRQQLYKVHCLKCLNGDSIRDWFQFSMLLKLMQRCTAAQQTKIYCFILYFIDTLSKYIVKIFRKSHFLNLSLCMCVCIVWVCMLICMCIYVCFCFCTLVCQETVWEAFKIFWDRLPEKEEYQIWMRKCQNSSVSVFDIGRSFSQSAEHLALISSVSILVYVVILNKLL